MNDMSFNILIDESGDTTNLKDNPTNRVMGALIFFEDYSVLETKFLQFVDNCPEIKQFIKKKPHDLKFETLKKQPNSEELFELALNFLIENKCKFYWHPIKDKDRKHQKKEYEVRFTKLVESCNLDILPNLILVLKRENKRMGKIGLYLDRGTYNTKNEKTYINIYFGDNSFNYYEAIGEHYQIPITYIKPKGLHWCADIIAGVTREGFYKESLYSKVYKLISNNRFADIVYGEFA